MQERNRVLDSDDVDGLRRLIAAGYPFDGPDEYGKTLLEAAAEIASLPLVCALLVEYDAPVRFDPMSLDLEFFDNPADGRKIQELLRARSQKK